MAPRSSREPAGQSNILPLRGKPGRTDKGRAKRGQVGPAQVEEAAAKLFREKGYYGTSMQDIGDAVGLHKGSLYPHIGSKEALLADVVSGALPTINQHLELIASSSKPPLAKMRDAIANHIDVIIENRDRIAVMLESSKFLSPSRRRSSLKLQKQYEVLLEQILEEGIQAGQFRPCDTKVVSFAIIGMCNWIYRWCSPKGRLSLAELAQVFADLILNGLALPNAETVAADGQEPAESG